MGNAKTVAERFQSEQPEAYAAAEKFSAGMRAYIAARRNGVISARQVRTANRAGSYACTDFAMVDKEVAK
jgi:hypothetical protein